MARHHKVLYKEVGGDRFPYIQIGGLRLWVSRRLIMKGKDGNDYITFPLHATIRPGKRRRTWIMKPSRDYLIVDVFVECGYRGGSSFQIREQQESWPVAKYYIYKSPRGALGISSGCLLQVPVNVKQLTVEWERSGRLYGGDPTGTTIIELPSGEEETFPGLTPEEIRELSEDSGSASKNPPPPEFEVLEHDWW